MISRVTYVILIFTDIFKLPAKMGASLYNVTSYALTSYNQLFISSSI